MIIYSGQDIPRTFSLDESVEIVLFTSEVSVGVAGMKLADLEIKEKTKYALERAGLEYVGEFSADVSSKIGMGLSVIKEVSNAIKEAMLKQSDKNNKTIAVIN